MRWLYMPSFSLCRSEPTFRRAFQYLGVATCTFLVRVFLSHLGLHVIHLGLHVNPSLSLMEFHVPGWGSDGVGVKM